MVQFMLWEAFAVRYPVDQGPPLLLVLAPHHHLPPRAPPPHRPSPHALLQRLSTLLTSTLQAMARYVGPGDGPGDKSSGSGLDKAAMADSAVSLAVWLVVGGGGVD